MQLFAALTVGSQRATTRHSFVNAINHYPAPTLNIDNLIVQGGSLTAEEACTCLLQLEVSNCVSRYPAMP